MQRLVLVSLAAVAVLAVAPRIVAAQGPSPAPAPLRIAYINSREILQRTPGYAVAESTYLKEVDAYRTEIQKLQQQLDSAVTAFDQQSIALSPAARQTKQRELQTLQQRMETRTNELQDRARQREQELLAPIQARVKSRRSPADGWWGRAPSPSPGSRRSSARVPAICLFLPPPATSPTFSAPARRWFWSRPRSSRRRAVRKLASSWTIPTPPCWWCFPCCTRRPSGKQASTPPPSSARARPGRSRWRSGRMSL